MSLFVVIDGEKVQVVPQFAGRFAVVFSSPAPARSFVRAFGKGLWCAGVPLKSGGFCLFLAKDRLALPPFSIPVSFFRRPS